MSCTGDISNLCAEYQESPCVRYDGPLGSLTTITDNCVNQYKVNEDLYNITDTINNKLNIDNLTSTCITIPTDATIGDIIILYEDKLCELQDKVDNIDYSQIDISTWGLDIDCLVDSCGDPITKLGQFLQAITTNTCNNNG